MSTEKRGERLMLCCVRHGLFEHEQQSTETGRDICNVFVCVCAYETQDARRISLFDWPVAFTKVILIVANCTLAKCSEEHVNHKK